MFMWFLDRQSHDTLCCDCQKQQFEKGGIIQEIALPDAGNTKGESITVPLTS
jgi:hypothetical protein